MATALDLKPSEVKALESSTLSPSANFWWIVVVASLTSLLKRRSWKGLVGSTPMFTAIFGVMSEPGLLCFPGKEVWVNTPTESSNLSRSANKKEGCMFISHKEPNIQFVNVNHKGKNWIVPLEQMTPKRTFVERYFPLLAVAVVVIMSTIMLIGAMRWAVEELGIQ